MEPEFLDERNCPLRCSMIHRLGLFASCALLALVVSFPASASQEGTRVVKNWRAMDQCAKKAQEAFPDHTAEANAKREAKLKACLANGNYAPRAPQQ